VLLLLLLSLLHKAFRLYHNKLSTLWEFIQHLFPRYTRIVCAPVPCRWLQETVKTFRVKHITLHITWRWLLRFRRCRHGLDKKQQSHTRHLCKVRATLVNSRLSKATSTTCTLIYVRVLDSQPYNPITGAIHNGWMSWFMFLGNDKEWFFGATSRLCIIQWLLVV
jgi:hypothetical protein